MNPVHTDQGDLDDPMTTETARMFYERAIKAEAEAARLRAYAESMPYPSDLEQLREENEMLRLAFCDEATIIAAQTFDVKALGKGRQRILREQVLRMARVGLGEGFPRQHKGTNDWLRKRTRELVDELSVASDEDRS